MLFFLFKVNSQTEKDAISLISFLNTTQEKFGYDFSYVNQELENINIIKPSNSSSFEQTLVYLRNNTPFDYTVLKSNSVAVSFKFVEICGVLVDITNKIISDASIQGIEYTTISDINGKFALKVNSPNEKIKISFLGYSPVTISALDFFGKPCKKIKLIQKLEYINEIVLNDYLIKGIDKQLDGSIQIDYNDFGILPGLTEPDLLQTIQALPGVLSVNETVSDINVRGGTNDQNLILWDGIKMYQSSHFFGLISAFNPYLTKNVQVYKNGSSAKYGDGVSSVIAMNTANKINNKLDASIGLNLISVDTYIDTPINKKSSIQLAVRHSINDILETPTYNQYFDKAFQNSEVFSTNNSGERFSFYDISMRWLYQLSPKDLIKVNALLMRNNLVFQENSSDTTINNSRESSATQNNIVGGILYQRNWSKLFQSELLLYGTNYVLETINSDIPNNQRLLQNNDVLENGIKLNTFLKTDANINLKNGYQFNETGISYLQELNNPTFRDLTKEVIRTHSLFSEIEYNSDSSAIYANLGARLNYLEKFDTYILEPRINFYKRFNNHFTIEVLGEIKSQSTSQVIDLQNDFLGIENRRWVLSNDENIPILKSKQASIGLSYNHNNWLITTDIYYKNVKGIITRSQGFQNQFEFSNDHGSYEVLGIDFLINKRFKNFSTWLSYSYADNEYSFSNLSPSNFANNIDIRHNVNFAAAYNNKNLKISAGVNWHSGKPTTFPNTTNSIENDIINYQNPNSNRLNSYTRIDLSSTYTFKIGKSINGLAGFSIWNLLNQENIFNQYFVIRNQSEIETVKEFGLGITPNAVFRLSF
ncbi:TonB-dependent receptor [Aquimarina sp. MMG015]|uniref:TonB-dependent receptor n=1 Tax=Aquimarina sp. MMG015 TaxID=2822689 RepID=UPI001B3A76DD|nr:TonB-dependent receptor plug domain-containing protein [Aquimarina sp. MMG015]MBQ4803522.1 TonB-dependent receptor [Aquimarina sp. MMG015]